MKRPGVRLVLVVLTSALGLSPAGAYYHFLHYTSKTAPYASAPETLDLAALPNKTVTFFVSTSGPKQFAAAGPIKNRPRNEVSNRVDKVGVCSTICIRSSISGARNARRRRSTRYPVAAITWSASSSCSRPLSSAMRNCALPLHEEPATSREPSNMGTCRST